jgi:hypothetical protein
MSEDTLRDSVPGRNGGTLTPYPKGKSGFAGKHNTAGAIIKNYFNGLARRKVSSVRLRTIIADEGKPHLLRSAAEQLLHSRSATTLADFDPWIKGDKSLTELRDAGIDVSLVKSASVSKDGIRRIELHDRAGQNMDRMMDQTTSRPKTEVSVTYEPRTESERETARDSILARIRGRRQRNL